jgi:hypothetical protein
VDGYRQFYYTKKPPWGQGGLGNLREMLALKFFYRFFPEKWQNNLDKSTFLGYNKGVVIKEGYVRIS